MFTITNGTSDIFILKQGGLTIYVPSDCLPPSMKNCNVEVTANLNTNMKLPSNSLLVSSVYNITLIPHIQKMNQPVQIVIDHCVALKPGQEDRLSFMIARGEAPTEFEYLEGGAFYVDPNTDRKTGRIHVSSFSWFAISWIWEAVSGLFAGPGPEYRLRVYYDDSETMS